MVQNVADEGSYQIHAYDMIRALHPSQRLLAMLG